MSREIRISIDDDEVFERLKRRKRELDLSWEEALRRGLGRKREPSWQGTPPRSPRPPHSSHSTHARRGRDRDERNHSDRPSPFDPDFGDHLRQDIERSVQQSVTAAEKSVRAVREGLDAEIDRLEDAEDAVLSFPFLDDEQARVPLRVNLETSADGLAVEVVAVRRGRDTADSNRFPDDGRVRVNQQLASSETARLELQDGAESYAVVPSLSWGRADDGTPTVTDVEISDVRFD